jgi:hypothetical protein
VPTIDGLIRPVGRLDPAWFGDTYVDLVQSWLLEAKGKTANTTAQTHWVEYRGFQYLLDDRMIDPAIQRDGDASSAYLNAQLGLFRSERDAALEAYNTIIDASIVPVSKARTLVEVF